MLEKIAVKDGAESVQNYRMKLSLLGLREEEEGKFSGRFFSKRKVERVKSFCDSHHLKFLYDNEYGERNTYYRYTFFSNNPPQVLGKYYFCAYCGRLHTRRYMTVDHLYPVGKVSKGIRMQKKLKRMGIKSINDEKNLVAACRSCNSAKSAKTGIWILRGRLGRHKWYWMTRWAVRIVCFVCIAYAVWALVIGKNPIEEIKSALNLAASAGMF